MARPGVCFGGPSPEHDISILTGLQALRALAAEGRDPVAIYWARTGEFHRVDAAAEARDFLTGLPARSERLDLVARPGGGFVAEGGRFRKAEPLELEAVLVACHGGPGEDGTLQGALQATGVPYTGPSVAGAALGMDKLAFAATVAAAGLETLPRHLLTAGGPDPAFAGPYILKPRFGGSSIGIEISDDLGALRALVRTSPHLRDGAVIEPYLADAVDLNVAVRTHPEVQVSEVERPLRSRADGRIYTYAEKYLGGEGMASAPRVLPADIPDDVRERIRAMALTLVGPALVRGAPRIDMLYVPGRAEGDLLVNEINTIPGSLGRYFWAAAGVAFGRLCRDLLDEARHSPTRRYTSDGADGSALRAAGSIAGKLA